MRPERPSATTAGALAALLVAAVLTGIALTIPGSGLGVRTEGTGTAHVPCVRSTQCR
ncbi:hypothetical protein [Streptomyces pseudovenezuelae]|uniref:Chaplin domain-containing protein n=1 Tax=Streptomyces pseudovenezuelae TaxID=67350 RepID=A0ABT6LNE6_9ACTN|nr:hypothetical protein [Streptomyces pseudovenezuelae]MDH6217820.1 hypothetical protein [Streptomyces pseudovenezuelae]